jgi:hypothetical protein
MGTNDLANCEVCVSLRPMGGCSTDLTGESTGSMIKSYTWFCIVVCNALRVTEAFCAPFAVVLVDILKKFLV